MFKVILKALAATAIMTTGLGLSAWAVIASFEYATQVFGRYGPLVSLGVICIIMMFSFFVSYFLYGANLKAEEK